jgi:hypothetical protein
MLSFPRFFYLLSLVSLPLTGDSYMIDDTCQGQDAQRVQEAADEALNMFAYANFRVTQNNPTLNFGSGGVFDQLLGPNQKDRLLRK